MMKKINYKWKYLLAGLMLVGFSACSNDSEGLLSSESTEVSRSSELVTQTITLTAVGTLQSSLEAAMSDPSTLQKLVLSGPFNAADVEYWKTTLVNLVEFDLQNAVPTYVEEVYYYDPYGAGLTLPDNQVGAHMLSYMTKLEKVIFPTVTTVIGYEACNGCTALTSADIPASVTYIANSAFGNCAFTSVTVPATVTGMETSVFEDNPELQTVNFLATIDCVPEFTFMNCSKLTTVVLGSDIKTIKTQAFHACSSLKDYTPFVNVEKLDWYSFAYTALESVDLTNVTEITEAFRACKSLTTVVLPPSMTVTPRYAFWECTALCNITWPTALETISDGTFGGAAFTELTIPSTVTSIGHEGFHANTLLTKVTLSEGLESIGSYAFNGAAFTEITIPSTVTYIGYGAFNGTKLTTLTIPATVKEVGGSLANDCSNLNALIWNSSAPVDDMSSISSNCYLYLANADVVVGPNWKNIIVDGVAESIELCADGNRTDSNTSFNVPIAFTAKKISFSRYFDAYTYPGISSGWQTIVLPFTPTTIEHESKGAVAPFNSGVADAKPFWLRELTADGFVDKTTMEPDKAYIIAMPNHDDYIDEYRLNGKITFSAENVELAATPAVLPASDGPEYSLQPTYNFVQRGVSVYALNVDYSIDGYEWGAVFARNIVDVYAFEAYVTTAGRSARSLFGMDTRSKASRTPYSPNKTGIPQIGDM